MADFVNKLKYFIGIDDLDMDEEYDEHGDDELEELPVNTRTKKLNDKVVNIHTAGNMKLVVHEPLNYEDAPKIVDDLKMRKTVVVNLEQLEPIIKRQIFDFINGGLYSLEGSIQKVTKDIFVLAPSNVEIDGNIKDELKNKGDFKLEKDTKNELILFPREDGELFLPAFTSQSEIEKTPLKNFFIVLEFTKLLEIFKSNKDSMKYFVINPSDNPYELSVDLLLEIFNDPNMIDKLNS